jgi:N-acetylglucosamine-6-phosphate deacetylase
MKVTARALSGQVCVVTIEDGRFAEIAWPREEILDLPWIAPGLVDIQINGFGGVDFNRALESDDAWRHATDRLYAHGCTGFLIALITNTDDGYRELLEGLTAQIRRDARNCLGFHMEGPWLNPDPGYRGAHRAEWMRKPEMRLLEDWRARAGELIRLITLAPEVDLDAAREVMRAGSAQGIRFFAGHSAAMGATLAQASEAGVVGWTHLGNAAPAQAPKFENVIFHALAQPRLLASLIPDGHHVPAHAFRVITRLLQQAEPSRLLLTTDAMAGAAASGPGAYTLGNIEVTVGTDGCARGPDSDRLAGSTLTPFDGVFLAERMSGLYLEETWRAFSSRPAGMLGIDHDLTVGHSADFCLIAPEQTPRLLATYHRGACVFEAE